ncbi:uncharacterized [Tachysurus ichikawai]
MTSSLQSVSQMLIYGCCYLFPQGVTATAVALHSSETFKESDGKSAVGAKRDKSHTDTEKLSPAKQKTVL